MTNIKTYNQMQSNLIVNGLRAEAFSSAEHFTPARDEWEEMNAIDSFDFEALHVFHDV